MTRLQSQIYIASLALAGLNLTRKFKPISSNLTKFTGVKFRRPKFTTQIHASSAVPKFPSPKASWAASFLLDLKSTLPVPSTGTLSTL